MQTNNASASLVSKRRKEMALWAVEKLKEWPTHPLSAHADPGEIHCEFVKLETEILPVLACRLGGGYVSSVVWFYAKRGRTLNQGAANA